MSMDQGAVFLASSILLMLGFIVIVAGAICYQQPAMPILETC